MDVQTQIKKAIEIADKKKNKALSQEEFVIFMTNLVFVE
jgi:hypothetical protein